MPGGSVFSILFFMMLAFAGITSMVGLIECVNGWLQDSYNMPRHKSALLVVGSVAVLSVLSILSYNVMGELSIGGKNFNDALDYFSNQILLPLGGLFIAIFAGWVVHKDATRDELGSLNLWGFQLWHFLIRFVVPPALLYIFIKGITA